MNRDFDKWLKTMKDTVATWTYYVDFKKVYENVSKVKVELNILNSLIGSKNIEKEFTKLVSDYPNVLGVIPILLAKRESSIKVIDVNKDYVFNFIDLNYSVDQYVLFMRNSGLFDLLENHIINNLVDYCLGVEVGMDTNGRKNRTGDMMEDIVESYLKKAGLVKNKTYFKEMNKDEIEKKFGLDLSPITNEGKVGKRFDFVFVNQFNEVYAIECNFYSSGGSKLNETARSYKNLALESKNIKRFNFVWITDGKGWESAKKNLEETFMNMEHLYNLSDLSNGVVEKLANVGKYIEGLVK